MQRVGGELDQPLEVQGTVTGAYERKGHRFVDLTTVIRQADGTPVCSVAHTAIYEPRQVREMAG